MTLLEELEARGLIHQTTEHEEPLAKHLANPGRVVYAGFDPTAPSLHVGHLIPLLGLRRFQRAGHRAVALAGGATGLVGDPSGKSEERNLLDREALAFNRDRIKAQLARFLEFDGANPAVLVDNLDWTGGLTLLDFLRDTGKHFKVNQMIHKDSVKTRLERDGAGISFTEFTYMLLQANDYLVLARERGCTLQIGGSDQWGNITAGIELIRRVLGRHVYGATCPLLTNADGSKFGKTVAGAVWLDPAQTSPFAFRQFWFQTPDADVVGRLKQFTFLPLDEVDALAQGVAAGAAPNAAQRALARHMTALVHGEAEAARVEKAVEVLFAKDGDLREIPAEYLADAFAGAPTVEVARGELAGDGLPLVDLVVRTIYAGEQKRGAAKRDVTERAIALNGRPAVDPQASVGLGDLLHDRFLVVRKGKKNHVLVRVVDGAGGAG